MENNNLSFFEGELNKQRENLHFLIEHKRWYKLFILVIILLVIFIVTSVIKTNSNSDLTPFINQLF